MRPEFVAASAAIALFALGDALAAAWGKDGRWWWFALMLVAGNLAWVLFADLNKSVAARRITLSKMCGSAIQ